MTYYDVIRLSCYIANRTRGALTAVSCMKHFIFSLGMSVMQLVFQYCILHVRELFNENAVNKGELVLTTFRVTTNLEKSSSKVKRL